MIRKRKCFWNIITGIDIKSTFKLSPRFECIKFLYFYRLNIHNSREKGKFFSIKKIRDDWTYSISQYTQYFCIYRVFSQTILTFSCALLLLLLLTSLNFKSIFFLLYQRFLFTCHVLQVSIMWKKKIIFEFIFL
jgi:hypothetical protein